jgi:hypothetical protein
VSPRSSCVERKWVSVCTTKPTQKLTSQRRWARWQLYLRRLVSPTGTWSPSWDRSRPVGTRQILPMLSVKQAPRVWR